MIVSWATVLRAVTDFQLNNETPTYLWSISVIYRILGGKVLCNEHRQHMLGIVIFNIYYQLKVSKNQAVVEKTHHSIYHWQLIKDQCILAFGPEYGNNSVPPVLNVRKGLSIPKKKRQ